MKRLMRVSGRPLSFSLVELDKKPGHGELMGRARRGGRRGASHARQIQGRAIGPVIGHKARPTHFITRPSYREIAGAPVAGKTGPADARAGAPGDPGRADAARRAVPRAAARAYERIFRLGDPPNYEPDPEHSFKARAAALVVADPETLVYDALAEGDGGSFLYFALANCARGDLESALHRGAFPNGPPPCSASPTAGRTSAIYPDGGVAEQCRNLAAGCSRPHARERLDLPFVVIAALTRDTAEAPEGPGRAGARLQGRPQPDPTRAAEPAPATDGLRPADRRAPG